MSMKEISGVIGGVLAAVVVIVGLMFAFPMYGRYQRLQEENNITQVNDIKIAQTKQLVLVAQQEAQIRIQEAKGIAASQKIINGTLTPQYLQHEAIEAQQKAAENSSHTETIYVPSGVQGIPQVIPVGHL